MRSRYRVLAPDAAHFVTSTIVAWLPVFTTAARCDILVQSLAYCRTHKGLAIYGWVILDNHFHAILAAPDLPRVMADMKRHTAQRILEQLEAEGCEWLLDQFRYRHAAHKKESEHQVWQEGTHPQAIVSDEMMLQKLEYLQTTRSSAGSSLHRSIGGIRRPMNGSRGPSRCFGVTAGGRDSGSLRLRGRRQCNCRD